MYIKIKPQTVFRTDATIMAPIIFIAPAMFASVSMMIKLYITITVQLKAKIQNAAMCNDISFIFAAILVSASKDLLMINNATDNITAVKIKRKSVAIKRMPEKTVFDTKNPACKIGMQKLRAPIP
jgi:hypothetical protein